MLVPFLRAVRRAPERLLHPMRRRRAVASLERRAQARFVLVMCYGNICRSPFAEASLGRLLRPRGVRVESAGLYGPGRPTPREGIDAAAVRGFDLSGHASRLVTTQLVAEADVVVVMDAFQARAIQDKFGGSPDKIVFLGDLDPRPIRTRRIVDPERQSVAVFTDVYERIDRCDAALAAALGVGPPPA